MSTNLLLLEGEGFGKSLSLPTEGIFKWPDNSSLRTIRLKNYLTVVVDVSGTHIFTNSLVRHENEISKSILSNVGS